MLNFQDESARLLSSESVDVYLFLKKRISANKKIKLEDSVFQFMFRSFYRLDNAGLGDFIKSAYFKLLKDNCENGEVDLRMLCDELGKYGNSKGKRTMQFSFATKMAATIDVSCPIYDSYVAKVFSFPAPYGTKDWDQRFKKYLSFYERLARAVSWLKSQEAMQEVLSAFDSKAERWDELPEMKKYDFIFWSTGKAISG